jgi:hypothetical protein
MKIATAVMLAAAFLPPLYRVLGFTGGVMFIFAWCANSGWRGLMGTRPARACHPVPSASFSTPQS